MIFELCGRKSAQVMAAITVLLLFVSNGCNAQEPNPAAVFRGDPAQLKQITGRASRIYDSAKATKTISDPDLAFILETANKKEFPALLVAETIKPLAMVKMDNLAQSQREQIFPLLRDLLSANDLKSDPDGFLKTYVNDVIRQSFQDKRLLPVVEKLRKDPRKSVRSSAEEAATVLRYRS